VGVPAGPDDVEQGPGGRIDGPGGVEHPLGEAGDLGLRLTFETEAGEQGTDLCVGGVLENG